MSRKPKTYEEATRRASKFIWPGCGDGRKRRCGRIHDYGNMEYNEKGVRVYVPDFRCWQNREHGCPHPIPEPSK